MLIPLARVAEGDLLEARAVAPVGAAGVEVAGDDDAGIEAQMPVFGPARAAPGCEAGGPWNVDQVAAQRIVVDENGSGAFRQGGQPGFGLLKTGFAPMLAAFVWRRAQEIFVCADGALFPCPADDLFAADMVGPETVVVKQEERGDDMGAGAAFPGLKRVFGCEDAEFAGTGDKRPVTVFSRKGRRLPVVRKRPEVVVSRNPEDPGELAGQRLESQADMV